MTKLLKLLDTICRGDSDQNVSFVELGHLLERLGFQRRVRGSHHIFWMKGVEEIINLQSLSGKAKPYQVKQVRNLILKYKMGDADV